VGIWIRGGGGVAQETMERGGGGMRQGCEVRRVGGQIEPGGEEGGTE